MVIDQIFTESRGLPMADIRSTMYVYVFTAESWCIPCRLYKTTLNDVAIKQEISAYSGLVIFDVDDPANVKYISHYRPALIPCTIIVDADGNEINRAYGYMTVNKLKKFLRELPANKIRFRP